MEQTPRNPELAAFDSLVGEWALEATHPMFPSTVVNGRMTYEWLERERFLVQRSSNDHPDFPDSISVIGFADDELTAHYFDSRGVFRIYRVAMEGDTLRMWRDEPGFSQRLEAKLSDDGATLAGVWQLSRDDETWADDLAITFTRAVGAGSDNEGRVRAFWEQAFNGRDLDLIDAITAPDFVNHNALPDTPPGPEGHRQVVERLWEAFPDAHFEIEHLASDGDTVVCIGTMSGTHEGTLLGVRATGRKVEWRHCHLYRFDASGRAVEHDAIRDDAGLLRQFDAAE